MVVNIQKIRFQVRVKTLNLGERVLALPFFKECNIKSIIETALSYRANGARREFDKIQLDLGTCNFSDIHNLLSEAMVKALVTNIQQGASSPDVVDSDTERLAPGSGPRSQRKAFSLAQAPVNNAVYARQDDLAVQSGDIRRSHDGPATESVGTRVACEDPQAAGDVISLPASHDVFTGDATAGSYTYGPQHTNKVTESTGNPSELATLAHRQGQPKIPVARADTATHIHLMPKPDCAPGSTIVGAKNHTAKITQGAKANPPVRNARTVQSHLKTPLSNPGEYHRRETSAPLPDIYDAGVLFLWPLLPSFFSTLELYEEKVFVSESARRQALSCLMWLVWGADGFFTEYQALSSALCGYVVQPDEERVVPEEAQCQQIDAWLTAVGQQLPGWENLSLTDIRQLFLQRSGQMAADRSAFHITIKPESWDLLLHRLPWPMNIVSLPWLSQPLTITWPGDNLAG